MDTWVKQTGYPVLQARVDRSDDGMDVSVSQERFVYEDVLGEGAREDTLWHVPVGVRTASDAHPAAALVMERQASIRVEPAPYGSPTSGSR